MGRLFGLRSLATAEKGDFMFGLVKYEILI